MGLCPDAADLWTEGGIEVSVTVKEIMQLKDFEVFHLVAGDRGLGRQVSNIGILDYEYANENPQLEKVWTFGKEAFVISSLLFAKDHPERILSAIKGLCRDGVSALAIKTIYYERLPEEVIAYAEQQAFPIFLFGRDDAYFENIVIAINNKIAEADRTDLIEQKIHLLLMGTLTPLNAGSLVSELVPLMPEKYCAVCYHSTHYPMTVDLNHTNSLLNNFIGKEDYLFKYKNNHLVILNLKEHKKTDDLKAIVQRKIRLLRPDIVTGISNVHEKAENMRYAFSECIFAAEYAAKYMQSCVRFSEIGIYRVLMPYSTDYWMKQYCTSILEPIMAFDREYGSELFRTMEVYVEKEFDVIETANALHLHKNTVRYRIKKVKEILGIEERARIEEELAIVFRVYAIQRSFMK